MGAVVRHWLEEFSGHQGIPAQQIYVNLRKIIVKKNCCAGEYVSAGRVYSIQHALVAPHWRESDKDSIEDGSTGSACSSGS